MTLVIFEGADRTGKTTAKLMFNKSSKYKHLVADRLFYSNWVYSKLRRKILEVDRSSFITSCKQVSDVIPIIFILVTRPNLASTYNHDQKFFKLFWGDWLNLTGTTGYVIQNDGSKEDLREEIDRLVGVLE